MLGVIVCIPIVNSQCIYFVHSKMKQTVRSFLNSMPVGQKAEGGRRRTQRPTFKWGVDHQPSTINHQPFVNHGGTEALRTRQGRKWYPSHPGLTSVARCLCGLIHFGFRARPSTIDPRLRFRRAVPLCGAEKICVHPCPSVVKSTPCLRFQKACARQFTADPTICESKPSPSRASAQTNCW